MSRSLRNVKFVSKQIKLRKIDHKFDRSVQIFKLISKLSNLDSVTDLSGKWLYTLGNMKADLKTTIISAINRYRKTQPCLFAGNSLEKSSFETMCKIQNFCFFWLNSIQNCIAVGMLQIASILKGIEFCRYLNGKQSTKIILV